MPAQDDEAIIGQKLATQIGVKIGNTFKSTGGDFKICGIVSGGGEEDNQILESVASRSAR